MTQAFAILDGVRVQERHEQWFTAVRTLTRKLWRTGYKVIDRYHGKTGDLHEVLLVAVPREIPHQSKH